MTPGRSNAEALRAAHRSRLAAWNLPHDGDEHEDQVVAFALAVLAGKEDAPITHEHAIEEMGMCLDCDTAAVLQAVRG